MCSQNVGFVFLFSSFSLFVFRPIPPLFNQLLFELNIVEQFTVVQAMPVI